MEKARTGLVRHHSIDVGSCSPLGYHLLPDSLFLKPLLVTSICLLQLWLVKPLCTRSSTACLRSPWASSSALRTSVGVIATPSSWRMAMKVPPSWAASPLLNMADISWPVVFSEFDNDLGSVSHGSSWTCRTIRASVPYATHRELRNRVQQPGPARYKTPPTYRSLHSSHHSNFPHT